jgi:hypothetical protein
MAESTEADCEVEMLGGAGFACGLRRTGWGANFMSYDSTKIGMLSIEIYSLCVTCSNGLGSCWRSGSYACNLARILRTG